MLLRSGLYQYFFRYCLGGERETKTNSKLYFQFEDKVTSMVYLFETLLPFGVYYSFSSSSSCSPSSSTFPVYCTVLCMFLQIYVRVTLVSMEEPVSIHQTHFFSPAIVSPGLPVQLVIQKLVSVKNIYYLGNLWWTTMNITPRS